MTISASADTDSAGNYVPAEGTDTVSYTHLDVSKRQVQDKTILTGDANQDGIVNVNDVTYLQMHIAGKKNTDVYKRQLKYRRFDSY